MTATFCLPSLQAGFSQPCSQTKGLGPALGDAQRLTLVSPAFRRGQNAAKTPWHRALHRGDTHATSSTAFALTFEEDDLVVAGSLIDGIQAVQVEWQASPETVDLSRLEGDQVLIASQSPEVLAWRNRLDITEPHCNPPSLGETSTRHVAAAESKEREMGAMN